MPIYVRWEWKKKTKTFLVIFYFFDDQSSSNLRFRLKVVNKFSDELIFFEEINNNPDIAPQTLMTWAPTHVENALMGDVLRYANIIDGLSLIEKGKLRKKLEIQVKDEDPHIVHGGELFEELVRDAPTKSIISFEGDEDWFFCSKLNLEYIEYLKKTLKPFLM